MLPEVMLFNKDDIVHQKVANTLLKTVESKFVASVNEKTKRFVMLSKKFDKPFVVFGEHKDYTPLQEQEEITQLSWQQSLVPIKLVLVPDGRLFTLNTHRSLAYLMRFGQNVRMQQIPYLFFDFSNIEKPNLVDVNGSVASQKNLETLFASATRLADRVQNGWRPKNMSYTLADLQKQLITLATKELEFE